MQYGRNTVVVFLVSRCVTSIVARSYGNIVVKIHNVTYKVYNCILLKCNGTLYLEADL